MNGLSGEHVTGRRWGERRADLSVRDTRTQQAPEQASCGTEPHAACCPQRQLLDITG